MKAAVVKGELTEADIDRSVKSDPDPDGQDRHAGRDRAAPARGRRSAPSAFPDLALRIALEGAVLLKNDSGVLPLSAATLREGGRRRPDPRNAPLRRRRQRRGQADRSRQSIRGPWSPGRCAAGLRRRVAPGGRARSPRPR
ncbi:hypothetical protein ACRAWD_23065 [Caulobacter segnis]